MWPVNLWCQAKEIIKIYQENNVQYLSDNMFLIKAKIQDWNNTF